MKPMKPEEIRGEMARRKVKPISIARDLQVSPSAITRVIDGEFVSRRIREAVANHARVPFERMWGKTA